MASSAQSLANKENAQHSTGPRTEEGKRTSSLNAMRHGLTSQLLILSTEDHETYARLQANLLADLKPEGATEQVLAQTICDTHWRLERARHGEANILALAQFDPLPDNVTATAPAEVFALKEAQAWIKHERVLRNIQHHEARLQRLLLKTLSDLKSLQEIRESKRQQLLDEAANTKIHHQSNNLPFDPAALGFVFTEPEIDRELKRIHVLHNPRRPFPAPLKTPQSMAEELAAFRQFYAPLIKS